MTTLFVDYLYNIADGINILHENKQNVGEQIAHEKLEALKQAREIIGDDILEAVLQSPALLDSTIAMLHSYASKYEKEKYIEKTLQRLIDKLPNERKTQKVA